MRTLLCYLLVLAPATAPAPLSRDPERAFDHSHAAWTELLAKHVAGDLIDYAGMQKDRAKLDGYLQQLQAVTSEEISSWTREQQFAFWIDVYNAHTVSLVAAEHPVDSIKDIGGLMRPVFKKAFIDMPALHPSGEPRKLSLDDVEHGILRPKFRDARVHAAVHCATLSCPPLRAEAYVAERLDQQLDEQTRKWLRDPGRNRFDRARSRVEISKIFDWFEEDFVRDAGSVLAWIAKYAPEEEAEWLTTKKVDVDHLPYSWKLNDLER